MSADVPAGCPRLLDGGDGPRTCTLVQCRSHLRMPGARGPVSKRLRAATFVDDTCARDVRARSEARGVDPTYREIGVLLSSSRQAVWRSAQVGLLKLRVALSRGAEMRRWRLELVRYRAVLSGVSRGRARG